MHSLEGPTDLDPQRIACMHNVLATVGSMLEDGIDALEAVRIAVEMICPYPPGIPLLVPGEILDKSRVEWLLDQKKI